MKIDSCRALISRLPMVVAAALLGFSALGAVPAVTPPAVVAPSTSAIQELLDERVKSDPGTGVVVGIIDHGKTTILTAGSSGTSRPLDEHSIFEIGSVTKTFTATILADMVLHHEANLADPVQQYLPSGAHVPTRDGKDITLLLLATHHSGLPRMPNNFQSTPSDNPEAVYTWDKLAAFLNSYALTRDPGATFEYSNLGGALLGDALADAAHTSYAALLQTRVLTPLGMNETSALPIPQLSPSMRERITVGHNVDDAVASPLNFDDALAAAGAIRSSVSDMLRYVRCNLGQGPLAADCLFAQQPRDTLPGNQIGLIWWTGDFVPLISHGGDTAGFHAAVAISPDHQRGVVVLTNGGRSADPLAQYAIDASLAAPKSLPIVTLSPSELDAYAGTYHFMNLRLVLQHEGDGLTAQIDGQPVFHAYASANDRFFFKAVPAVLTFTRDSSGAIDGVVNHQNARNTLWARDGMTPPEQAPATPAPAVVTLDASVLAQYAGTYLIGAGAAFTVAAGGDSGLTVQSGGAPPTPLYASAKDHFFFKNIDVEFDFTRDPRGYVNALVTRGNFQELTALRQ
jgi:serine-type D-Ala-D-Ala carboxypeptidase/endopeptidase